MWTSRVLTPKQLNSYNSFKMNNINLC